ncbi:MAG: hydrolase [Lachnospiraceae bacterium]|nr:hydrolase [Lachnospiraceae bacterium]
MNIRKVDDKPMDIHTKKGMRIHKYRRVKPEAGSDHRNTSAEEKVKHRRTGSKIAKLEQKKKSRSNTKRLIKAAEVETTKAASEKLEGGEEVHQASMLAYEALRPVSAATGKGASLLKESMLEQKRKKYKIVTPMAENGIISKQSIVNKASKTAINKVTSNTAKHAVKAGAEKKAETTAKRAAKETAKTVTKVTTKAVVSTAGTVAGTAATGVGGVLIGQATVAGLAIDHKDMRQTVRNRKIKFFLDKMKAEQKQTDSVAKMIRDTIGSKAKFYVGKAAVAILGVLGGIASIIALVAIPIVLIITLLYNSPLALFLPPLTSGDTVQTVTNTYVTEFVSEVETLARDHTRYDEGEVIYRDPDGNVITPMPQQDIMSVYMVEYGVGDTASIMSDRAKKRLKNVVEDMCQYTTSDRTEERKDDKNKKYDVTILEVNVVIKDYQDMVAEYRFSQEQITLIEQMMNY